MRVMIVVWPLPAHLNPAVPLARSLLGAGHEVRVASHPCLVPHITGAGLHAVPLGTEDTVPSPASVAEFLLPEDVRQRLSEAVGVSGADPVWDTFSTFTLASSRIFHPPAGSPAADWTAVDALVGACRSWRPDLVLWDPNWPSAAVAARDCGAAQGRLLWGHDFTGAAHRLAAGRAAGLAAAGLADPVAEVVRGSAERYGAEIDEELLTGSFTLDPLPADARLGTAAGTIALRRIPYAGAAAVPDWLDADPGRPRVAVSLGVTQRAYDNDRDLVGAVLETVAELDVDVVATLDEAQLAGRTVPANTRTVDYLPLDLLLPTCDALVHHGGIGTLSAAVAHGVPQLVVGDATAVAYAPNAEYVRRRGAGLSVDAGLPVPELRKALHQVLTGPGFAAAARRLRREWLTMPAPHDVVPVLERLVAEERSGAV